jgi:hypothetical protein
LPRTSTDGGWTWQDRGSPNNSQTWLGDVTWDFKYVSGLDKYFGAVATFGDLGPDGYRHGHIGLSMGDGVTFADQVLVNVAVLNDKPDQQSINNGGLLRDHQGSITGRETAFFFGTEGRLQNQYGRRASFERQSLARVGLGHSRGSD